LLAVLTLAPGCSREAPAAADPRVLRLQQLFHMAQIRKKGNQPRPTRLADFKPMEQAYPLAFGALQRGECVLDWRAYADPSAPRATTVLAYEKGVPREGGYVLLLDGTVKNMTAEEFKARPAP
jgi:hypothetical protein